MHLALHEVTPYPLLMVLILPLMKRLICHAKKGVEKKLYDAAITGFHFGLNRHSGGQANLFTAHVNGIAV
jgi:hypothetical protein